MKPVFRPTELNDQTALSAFLARIFRCNSESIFLDPALMAWKYWQPRRDWDGSRSYVIERDGAIVAHGAAWPLHLDMGDGLVRGFFWIDWAADPTIPGIGVALMQRMAKAGGLIWSWGGTSAALRMRTVMGFMPRHAVSLYARPLRPFRQALVRENHGWKALPHFVRNCIWNFVPMRVETGWSAVTANDENFLAIEQRDPLSVRDLFHYAGDLEFVQYLSQCPVARFQSFRVLCRSQDTGAFALMHVPGQTRIVYAWINHETHRGWLNLYALAAQEAMKDQQSCEITVWCAVAPARRALEQLGFRERARHDLMVYDLEGKLPKESRFHLQMLHGDGAFLHPGRPEFIT